MEGAADQRDGASDAAGEASGERSNAARRSDIEETAVGRWSVGALRWLLARTPTTKPSQIIVFTLVFLAIMVPSVGLLIVGLTMDRDATQGSLETFGYPGVFFANLLSTSTVFIPVPGLTAVAQALIITQADVLNPWAVGLLGGLGMGLGEATAYLTGVVGGEVARETNAKGPRRLQPALNAIIGFVNRLMDRYGVPTLFFFSVIPNPIFEFAGITAGATGMAFRKFMATVVSGNLIRGLLLAHVGNKLIPF